MEAAFGREPAFQHHLGALLEEGVRRDPGVRGVHDVAVVVDLKDVVEAVGLALDGSRNHEAVQLQLLALPRCGLGHDFVDMFVVLGALAQRRPHQAAEGQREHEHRQADLDSSLCHKEFDAKDV